MLVTTQTLVGAGARMREILRRLSLLSFLKDLVPTKLYTGTHLQGGPEPSGNTASSLPQVCHDQRLLSGIPSAADHPVISTLLEPSEALRNAIAVTMMESSRSSTPPLSESPTILPPCSVLPTATNSSEDPWSELGIG